MKRAERNGLQYNLFEDNCELSVSLAPTLNPARPESQLGPRLLLHSYSCMSVCPQGKRTFPQNHIHTHLIKKLLLQKASNF